MSGAATEEAGAAAGTLSASDLAAVAEKALAHLAKRGAKEAAVTVERRREVGCEVRERRVEKLQESASASLSAALYVDGRYSSHASCDLAWPALERFLDRAVAMTRVLEPDPFRSLPDPKLYEGRACVDLGLADPGYHALDASGRKRLARELEEAALAAGPAKGPGGEEAAIQSVTAEVGDARSERVRATSNGFFGREETTSFWASAAVTMREGLKRPEDWWAVSARRRDGLGEAAAIGREAAARAKGRVGARKVPGGAMTVLVENRAAGRLLHLFLAAAHAPALQQKRSFLEGKIGAKVASERLTLVDDPLIPGGLGSRLFDGEGIAARRLPILEAGVLRNYYVDWYYGRKLGLPATTGGPSNLLVAPGTRLLAEIERSVERGVLVTSFLGGNSNSLTGDFSLGIQGVLLEKGARTLPLAEMNLAGNHLDLWTRLAEVGSDPWLFGATRTPSLLFDGVSVAGA